MVGTGRYDWVTSYDLTVGVKVDMDEAIYLTSPVDSPLLTGVDSDGLSVLGSLPTDQRKVEWLHDAILTPRTTLVVTAITAATTITVAAGDGFKFNIGDVLRINDEHMLITGISTDVLTVTRGTPWGTAVQHAAATPPAVIGVGSALREGSDPPDSRVTDRSPFYNVTQIFGPEQVELSGTEQVVTKYGVANEFKHQLFQRVQELTIRREQALLYGKRVEDDAGMRRTMGGLLTYITTGLDSTETQLEVSSLATIQQASYGRGGAPDRVMANPIALGDLNLTSDTARVRMDAMDTARGRAPAMVVYTEFGPLTVVRNRWLRPSDAVIFSREQAIRRVLRPLILEKLAKTGDRDAMQFVCEETLEVKGQEHSGRFSALAYS